MMCKMQYDITREEEMDHQFNQNNQQSSDYWQGNGNQQGNAYQQGNTYQQGNFYQQGNTYQQGNSYMGNNGANYGGGFEPEKAPNIFQQFVLAFVPTKYSRLTRVKTGSMIGFVTLLALIATVISFFSFALEISAIDMEEVADSLPDFSVRNGQLHLDEDFCYDEGGVFIYMTEDIDEFYYEDAEELADEGYQNILLIGRDRLSLMQNHEYQQLNLSDLGSLEISRTWIVTKLIPLVLIFAVIGYVIFFVGRVLWYFLCAAVYLLIAMLISTVMNKHLETGALFRTAVYAKVFMFVIVTFINLLPLTGFSIPFLLRVAATVVFMSFAIAKLPGGRLHTAPPMPMGQGWQ